MKNVELFCIVYSEETLSGADPEFSIMNNIDSEKNDWREYWPIRNFLLRETLDTNCYYGFLSPRFNEKTGLTPKKIKDYMNTFSDDIDVFSFSPQPDMGAFFLNVFEQEELFQPGFTEASEAFLASVGIKVDLKSLVMDSRQIIFSNYFVARPDFWREWLAINEKLFAVCEGEDCDMKRSLVIESTYPGSVQRKVFLMERLASLLLTLNSHWRVRAYNTFDCAWSASRLADFRFEAVLSDALKIAMKEQGFHNYHEAFARLRDKLR